jgi:rhamnose utilization protein RhaD (predicted bifunctional aldolase and dehydrogenase)
MNSQCLSALLDLSHELGQEARGLAILGEGNTSTRLDDASFAVKASGSSLSTLDEKGVACCRIADVLALFEREDVTDEEVEATLLASRLYESDRKPSTEALFHAYLLTLPDVHFVGHTHPIHVNALLCSPRAEDFASKRLFPDEIVCCGATSVLVPYVNPGVPLARAIRERVEAFHQAYGRVPRLVLLQNHGIIALGATPQAVLATTLMAEKAARIHLGAASIGGSSFLSDEQVAYIAGWTAELYRQKVLNL